MKSLFQTLIDNCNAAIAGHTAQLEMYRDCLRGQAYILAGEGYRVVRNEQGVRSIAWHFSSANMCGVVHYDLETAKKLAALFTEQSGETVAPIHVDAWHRRQIAEAQATLEHGRMMLANAA